MTSHTESKGAGCKQDQILKASFKALTPGCPEMRSTPGLLLTQPKTPFCLHQVVFEFLYVLFPSPRMCFPSLSIRLAPVPLLDFSLDATSSEMPFLDILLEGNHIQMCFSISQPSGFFVCFLITGNTTCTIYLYIYFLSNDFSHLRKGRG